uniref:Uncharacterized protein n=1 Tax=viral metagenome TaxID=1070528 RepID=A0A6H1ZV16_9ZZZZ
MHSSLYYIKLLRDPDKIDYLFRNGRGEFSIHSELSFEKHLKRNSEFYSKHPEMREKRHG